jgi:putative SOS response-associated peptidase YedK
LSVTAKARRLARSNSDATLPKPETLKAILKPYDPALMEAYAVNRAVNSVKIDTEECLEPAP